VPAVGRRRLGEQQIAEAHDDREVIVQLVQNGRCISEVVSILGHGAVLKSVPASSNNREKRIAGNRGEYIPPGASGRDEVDDEHTPSAVPEAADLRDVPRAEGFGQVSSAI